MKRFGISVVLLASVAAPRALARGARREATRFIRVGMKDVLSHPEAFLDKRVVFEAYFAGLGNLYRPFNTPFIRDHHVNFRAWDLGSKLWLKQARESAFVSLYCPRSKKKLTDYLQSLKTLSAIRIYGRVRVVYGGHPWLEVDSILRSKAQTYTEKGLKHTGLGMKRLGDGDYLLAVRSFETALGEGMPRGAEALVSRSLGEAYYKLGRYAEAEQALAKALDILSEQGRPDPDLYMRLGQTYNELGRYEDALKELRKALDIEPGLAEAHAAVGLTLGNLKRYREGLMACDTALKLKVLPVAHRNKAIIYLVMENTDLAIRSYKDAIMAHASWPQPHKELGDVYMDLARYEDAEDTYSNLIILERQKARGYILRAKAKLKQGTPEAIRGGMDDYQTATKVDPQYIPGYLGLAEIYVKLRQPEEATKQLEEAVRVDPQHVEAHMSFGRVLEMVDRLNEAAEEYARACDLEKQYVEARFRYGLALWNKPEPEWDDAITELETARALALEKQKALRSDADEEERKAVSESLTRAFRTLGRFYAEMGRFKEALVQLGKAKRLKEDDVTTRLWLAETLRRMGNNSAALKQLEETAKLDPQNMYAKANHAFIISSRDTSRAVVLAEEAFRSDPKNPDFLYILGVVEHKRGRGRSAEKKFLDAAKTSKTPDVFYHLAVVSHEGENLPDAMRHIQKADELLKALPAEGAGRRLLGRKIGARKRLIEDKYKQYIEKYPSAAVVPGGLEGAEGKAYAPMRPDAPAPPAPEAP